MRRRVAREAAIQILYSLEGLNASERERVSLGDLVSYYTHYFTDEKDIDAPFLTNLLEGVVESLDAANELIQKESDHWKLERMAMVDRNILRVALFEMKNRNDVPYSVSINEAVEIGKRFGTDESGAFINGILDQIRKVLPTNPEKAAY